MPRLTDLVLRHRRLVALAWLVLAVAGGWAASGISDALSRAFDAPGRPAFDYGLSLDDEVFMLSRIQEEDEATGSTDEAIVRGLGRTGRLVTSAALVLVRAFVALGAGPNTEIKILATGILLDARIVRSLVVPALVTLFGRWNWWLPRPLARLLRVR